MEYLFRPLVKFPKERTRNPKRAPFGCGYGRTLIYLDRELRHLKARSVVIQADCDEDDIRLDGRLRSTARMRSQAVVLTIELPDGPMSMPCDTFTRWEDNLRAICLTLERLRAIDRYGVTRNREQYRGWKALPQGGAIEATEWTTAEDAARFLLATAGHRADNDANVREVVSHHYQLDFCWKSAAKRAHPDVGGSDELMAKVNRAKEFIEKAAARAGGAR